MNSRRIWYIDVTNIPLNQIEGYMRGVQDIMSQMNDNETLKREMRMDPNFKIEGIDGQEISIEGYREV